MSCPHPDGPFYKGVRGYCKECWKNEMRLNRIAKREQYHDYERNRRRRKTKTVETLSDQTTRV